MTEEAKERLDNKEFAERVYLEGHFLLKLIGGKVMGVNEGSCIDLEMGR